LNRENVCSVAQSLSEGISALLAGWETAAEILREALPDHPWAVSDHISVGFAAWVQVRYGADRAAFRSFFTDELRRARESRSKQVWSRARPHQTDPDAEAERLLSQIDFQLSILARETGVALPEALYGRERDAFSIRNAGTRYSLGDANLRVKQDLETVLAFAQAAIGVFCPSPSGK
jgi:hypothetical protein